MGENYYAQLGTRMFVLIKEISQIMSTLLPKYK